MKADNSPNDLTWCGIILEDRAKIPKKKLRWLFGRFEDTKIHFRD